MAEAAYSNAFISNILAVKLLYLHRYMFAGFSVFRKFMMCSKVWYRFNTNIRHSYLPVVNEILNTNPNDSTQWVFYFLTFGFFANDISKYVHPFCVLNFSKGIFLFWLDWCTKCWTGKYFIFWPYDFVTQIYVRPVLYGTWLNIKDICLVSQFLVYALQYFSFKCLTIINHTWSLIENDVSIRIS